MTHLVQNPRSGAAAAGLALAFTLVAPALAQDDSPSRAGRPMQPIRRIQPAVNGAAISRSLGSFQLPQKDLRIHERKALPFQKFDLRDPETGGPIAGEKMLTLPNGRQIPAGKYYAELNRLEEGFNKMGYSLRSEEDRVRIQESKLDLSRLEVQKRDLIRQHLPGGGIRNLPLPDLEREHREGLRAVPGPATRLVRPGLGLIPPISREVHTTKTWGHTLGDPSVFSAHLHTSLKLDGTSEQTKLSAEGRAGGSVFSRSADILRVTGDLAAPKTGPMNASLAVYVLGAPVYNQNKTQNAIWIADDFGKSIDFNTSMTFMLGPIPMNARMGAHGDAGLRYSVSALPTRVGAVVGPYAHSRVYVQAGVDIVVAGAGAGANLTLVDYEGTLTGGLRIDTDPDGKLFFKQDYAYGHELDMLSGNVYVYAYVYVPRFGIPPWKKKQWDWVIWDWSGFHTDGTVFSGSNKIYL